MATLALNWCHDASDGIRWKLRAIREDGSFYGDVLNLSSDPARRRGTTVSGQLSAEECAKVRSLVETIKLHASAVTKNTGPSMGALFERASSNSSANDVRLILEYRPGDELHSESAKALVELADIVQQHVKPFIEKMMSSAE